MDTESLFRSTYLEWLGVIWERLEDLEAADSAADRPAQSPDFARALYRVRRECEILSSSVDTQRAIGLVAAGLAGHIQLLLQDMHWLLDVSPAAPPALARQCLRMAQDRIFAEVQGLPGTHIVPKDPAALRSAMAAEPV